MTVADSPHRPYRGTSPQWGRLGGGQLARGEYHLVIRVIAVPPGDQFFGGLADVLRVENLSGENIRDVSPIRGSGIRSEGNRGHSVRRQEYLFALKRHINSIATDNLPEKEEILRL
jgi:hypothetical protein